MDQSEREEKIVTCLLTSNYSENYLKSLSDEELLAVYTRILDGREKK